jgi:hypothetical protein
MIRTVRGRDGWWVIVERTPRDYFYGPFGTEADAATMAQHLVASLTTAPSKPAA